MNANLLKSCAVLSLHVMLLGGLSQAAQAAKPAAAAKLTSRQAAASAAAPAQVKLAKLNGNVLVNTGVAYQRAVPEQVLKTGAKIITTQGASVSVRYEDGCVKALPQNTMLTIGAQSECMSNSFKERVYVAEAIGEQAVDLGADLLPSTVSTASAAVPAATVSVGAAISAFTVSLLTTVATTNADNPTISSE